MSAGASLDAAGDAPARDGIAIIGIGCRYPGVHGPGAFWELMRAGRSTVGPVPPERVALGYDLDRYLDPRPRVPGRVSSPYGGFLEHPDRFDPLPFGLTPREVRAMEPQQRLMVEVAWDAILDAGIAPDSLRGERVAVILGHMAEDYSRERIAVLGEDTVNRSLDVFTVAGMSRAVLSGRIAYLLGVTGPSFTLDTACSSSLIATHLACQSLLAGESRLALAGGVNLFLTPEGNIALSRSGMLAPDGRCKAFDAAADGFVRAEGAGVVLLRPLRDALAAGDPVYAVIRGTGISTDGRDGGHMMAPGRFGQAQAMRDAYARAGVSPADVDFVEAHGTGTVIGDPVEIAALADVMGPGRAADRPLRVSSVKGSFGHTESASGVAGLIRTALALWHRELPAQLHFETPTPHIPWDEIPVRVQTRHEPWPGEGSRLAGVNSFGISGTNAHVVLESAPEPPTDRRADDAEAGPRLFAWSAHDGAALDATLDRQLAWLRSDAPPDLRDLAYTLGCRSPHDPHRFAAVASDRDALADEIEAQRAGRPSGMAARGQVESRGARELVLVFPGQGAQTAGMGRTLLESEPAFRTAIEALDAAYARHADWSLVDALRDPEGAGTLARLSRLQPTLVAVEIAIAALLRHWGIWPDAVVGQSLGEIAAAHVAGCLDTEAVARLACHRGRLVERVAGLGAMALVGLPEVDVASALRRYAGRLEIAGSSAPTSTIVAGDRDAIDEVVGRWTAREVFARRLDVDFASHCFHMDPLLEPFAEAIAGLRAAPGTIPFYSTVERSLLAGEALDGAYWVRNLRAPVAFAATLERLVADGARQLVEVSPHPTLARAIPETTAALGTRVHYVCTLARGRDERASLRAGLAQLWVRGAPVDFAAEGPTGAVLRMPPYPYQRRRFWFGERTRADLPRAGHALLGRRTDGPLDASSSVWQTTLDVDAAPWLADYRIDGERTVPAATHVELALAAAREAWPERPITLRDLRVWPPLPLDAAGRATLQVVLERRGEDGGTLRIASREQPGGAWALRATCRVVAEPTGPPSADAPPAIGAERPAALAPGALAARLDEQGLALGARMTTWREWVDGESGRRAQLALPRIADSESHAFAVHPALLEACWLLAGSTGQARTLTSVEEIRFVSPVLAEATCTVSSETDPTGLSADATSIHVAGEDGRIALSLSGVRTRPVALGATAEAPAPAALHRIAWRRIEPTAVADRPAGMEWVLCGDDEDALASLAAELAKLGAHCLRRRVDDAGAAAIGGSSGVRGLALLADARTHDEARALSRRLDALAEALVEEGALPARLWLVTRGDFAGPGDPDIVGATDPAPVAGAPAPDPIGVGAERVFVTWDDDGERGALSRLAHWMVSGTGEPRLALRAGTTWAPRVEAPITGEAASRAASGWAPAGSRCFAARIVSPGEPDGVELREHPAPEPGPGALRIAVEAGAPTLAAVDHVLGVPTGEAPGTVSLDAHLVGTVTAVGPGVTSFGVGDRVAGRGPLAREVCLGEASVAPLPPALSATDAAGYLDALATATAVLDDMHAREPEQTVWIHGVADALGMAAVAAARAAGVRVLVSGADTLSQPALTAAGAEMLPEADHEDLGPAVLAATAGRGADAVLCLAPRLPVSRDLEALRAGGRLVDACPRDDSEPGPVEGLRLRANRAHCRVDVAAYAKGAPARWAARMREAAGALSSGRLAGLPDPVVLPIGQLARALRLLGQGRAPGPVVVHLGDAASTGIRTADGRARLFDPDRLYAVVCPSEPAAQILATWMRARGAGAVELLRDAPTGAAPEGAPRWHGVLVVDGELACALGGTPANDREGMAAPPCALHDGLAAAAARGFFLVATGARALSERWLAPGPAESATFVERLVSARRAAGRSAVLVHVESPSEAGRILGALEAAFLSPPTSGALMALAQDPDDESALDRTRPLFDRVRAEAERGAGASALREQLVALAPPERCERVSALILDAVAVVLGMGEADRARLSPDAALDELGLDSLMTLEVAVSLHRDLGVTLDRQTAAPGRSVAAVARAIANALAGADAA